MIEDQLHYLKDMVVERHLVPVIEALLIPLSSQAHIESKEGSAQRFARYVALTHRCLARVERSLDLVFAHH